MPTYMSTYINFIILDLMSLYLYLSLSFSLSLSHTPSTRPSTRLWWLVRLSFYLYMRSLNWQSLCPSVCPFIFFVCRFSIQSLQHVSVNIYYVGLINQLPVCLSVFRSVFPPIRLSVCPSKCPSYCLSTRPFFHFSITNWSLTQFNVFIQRKRNT